MVGSRWVQNGSIDELQLKMVSIEIAVFSYSETTSCTFLLKLYGRKNRTIETVSLTVVPIVKVGCDRSPTRPFVAVCFTVSPLIMYIRHAKAETGATPDPNATPVRATRYEEPGADHEAVKLEIFCRTGHEPICSSAPREKPGGDHAEPRSRTMTISRTPNEASRWMRLPKQSVEKYATGQAQPCPEYVTLLIL